MNRRKLLRLFGMGCLGLIFPLRLSSGSEFKTECIIDFSNLSSRFFDASSLHDFSLFNALGSEFPVELKERYYESRSKSLINGGLVRSFRQVDTLNKRLSFVSTWKSRKEFTDFLAQSRFHELRAAYLEKGLILNVRTVSS